MGILRMGPVEFQSFQLRQGMVLQISAAVADPFQSLVVGHHDLSVSGHLDIQFDTVRSLLRCQSK